MTPARFNPANHYWDNGTDVFSSASLTRVPYSNAAYVAWLAAGNVATRDPGLAELRNILRVYGIGLRTLTAIFTDLKALSAGQKGNINTDLFTGSPLKVLTDAGPNASAIGAMWIMTQVATLSAADITLVKLGATAAYVRDNPSYLITPVFDATINVNGMTF